MAESAIDIAWNVDTRTPGEPKGYGVIERIIGRVKEGIRTSLRASALDPKWRPYAGRHFSFAWYVIHQGECPYLDRFGQECLAPKIPLGALVGVLPILRNNTKVRRDFGAVAIKGVFLADHTHTG